MSFELLKLIGTTPSNLLRQREFDSPGRACSMPYVFPLKTLVSRGLPALSIEGFLVVGSADPSRTGMSPVWSRVSENVR